MREGFRPADSCSLCTFIEQPLCSRHLPRHWEYSSEPNRQNPRLHVHVLHLMGRAVALVVSAVEKNQASCTGGAVKQGGTVINRVVRESLAERGPFE